MRKVKNSGEKMKAHHCILAIVLILAGLLTACGTVELLQAPVPSDISNYSLTMEVEYEILRVCNSSQLERAYPKVITQCYDYLADYWTTLGLWPDKDSTQKNANAIAAYVPKEQREEYNRRLFTHITESRERLEELGILAEDNVRATTP